MVIVLDKHKQPFGFTTERRARILLTKRRACVYKYYPFTIIVKDKDAKTLTKEEKPEYRVKIDPGSKHTGIAVVREKDNTVMVYLQIEHRGEAIVQKIETRNKARRNRRQRETRYRKCKWINHYLKKGSKYKADSPRPKDWLPPSVMSIVNNIIHWVNKLDKVIGITKCSVEAVRFDTQLLDSPDIEGVQYQQGELFGYEVKEYLLDKYGHVCQYCGGKSGDNVLEWEHIHPKSRGGSDSVKNATLACHKCNQEKGNKTLEEWLTEISKKAALTDLDEARVKGICNVMQGKTSKISNRYCAWVNSYRKCLQKALFLKFGEVECSSGGKTKYNRKQLNLPKDHHYDALCVGNIPDTGFKDLTNGYCLYVKANGRGNRLRGNINCCGVIITKYKDNTKRMSGIQSGDIVVADVPLGASKYVGIHKGRVTIRKTGYFSIKEKQPDGKYKPIPVNQKYCRVLQHTDGYEYQYQN